jgi:hypothetical protein
MSGLDCDLLSFISVETNVLSNDKLKNSIMFCQADIVEIHASSKLLSQTTFVFNHFQIILMVHICILSVK